MRAGRVILILAVMLSVGCGGGEEQSVTVLVLSSGERIENPTDEDIRAGLSKLDRTVDPQAFAILERGVDSISAIGDQMQGFTMEYRNIVAGEHYRSKRHDVFIEEVAQAFIAFRDKTANLADYGEWIRLMR